MNLCEIKFEKSSTLVFKVKSLWKQMYKQPPEVLCITASENILASGNLFFRVLKLQLKVINKNICYLYNAD